MSHLKRLLARHGITQTDLARIISRDKSVITNLFQGKRQLKADEAARIASHIGVPVAQVMGIKEKALSGMAESPALIPFHADPVHRRKSSHIVKKDGRYYFEDSEGSHSPKVFALEVRDDSMNLSGILPGDIIISELDRACKPKQLVVAQHYHGRGATTVVRRYEAPLLVPHSTSSSYKPLNLENDEARLVSPVLKLIRVF